MRRILFDMISTQGFINGGAEYVIRVFEELMRTIAEGMEPAEVHCLFARNKEYVYLDYTPDAVDGRFPATKIVFLEDASLEEIVGKNDIDVMFIGIGQRYSTQDFSRLSCRVVIVIHDVYTEEIGDFDLLNKLLLNNKWLIMKSIVRSKVALMLGKTRRNIDSKFIRGLGYLKNTEIVTVSEYSKNSLMLFGNIREERIMVLYSPEKICEVSQTVQSEELKRFLELRKKYIMIVSADRPYKNAMNALLAFKKYRESYDDEIVILTIGLSQSLFEGHYCMPFLSASDLEHAYRNCHALLYPTLIEGFGYPPQEVMKYGKPVLASNVCSIPEVYGQAPVYFSPYYKSDIVFALRKLKENYSEYSNRSRQRYREVADRQKTDLEKLIRKILYPSGI